MGKVKVWVLVLEHPIVEDVENKPEYRAWPYLKLLSILNLVNTSNKWLPFLCTFFFQSVENIHGDTPNQADCIEQDFLSLWNGI